MTPVALGSVDVYSDAARLLAALPAAVKAQRATSRTTQAQLAAMLGTNATAISNFERGLSRTMTPLAVIGLMRFCGWTVQIWDAPL